MAKKKKPIPLPGKKIKKHPIEAAIESHRKHELEKQLKIQFPDAQQMYQSYQTITVTTDLVSVAPMASAGGPLIYLDYVYGKKKPKLDRLNKDLEKDLIRKTIRVDESNIEDIRTKFLEEGITIGDDVWIWDAGGWDKNQGRSGECIIRNNNQVIAIRITNENYS